MASTSRRCLLLGCTQKAIGIWALHTGVDAGMHSEQMIVTERVWQLQAACCCREHL